MYVVGDPEKVLQWQKIAKDDPARVVRVLSFPGLYNPAAKTRDGDPQAAMFPALSAVHAESTPPKRSRGSSRPKITKVWEGLIHAGIIDALCKNVRERTLLTTLPPVDTTVTQDEFEDQRGQVNIAIKFVSHP